MSRSKRRLSLKPIRSKYTYTPQEIADLYGLHAHTVFRWIRNEDLKRIPGSKKYYVYGADLIAFLKKRNRKSKKPCAEDQIYCCKCRVPRSPNKQSLKSEVLANKTVRVYGRCTVCNTRMNKIVSGKKWSELHPLHPRISHPVRNIMESGSSSVYVKEEGNARYG